MPPTLLTHPPLSAEFRYAEVFFTDAITGARVDVTPDAFALSFWRVRYRYDDASAARMKTASPDLDSVFDLCATTLRITTLDMYADSNTRQRSLDCMADDTTAALSHYATTSELAFPRMAAQQIMFLQQDGYISRE